MASLNNVRGPRDLPPDVKFEVGIYVNRFGIKLSTFSFELTNKPPKGIVYLAHGYSVYTLFDWLLPQAPGDCHDTYSGSVIEGLVIAGFAVRSLDHTGHGYSEGTRCYFDSFDQLVIEATDYIHDIVRNENETFKHLPCFLFGISMGGATCLKMALLSPNAYSGIVLYAPMISLDRVREQPILGPIRNAHLEPIAGCISTVVPFMPIARPALNTLHPLSQKEMDDDPLTYSGDVRARVANEFMLTSREFMDGGLTQIKVPFITFHSIKDTFTDPHGSETLYHNALSQDKTYLKVGPNQDVDVDMWHALSAEPGRDVVFARVREWLLERV